MISKSIRLWSLWHKYFPQYVILHVLTLGATDKPCQQKISSKWGKCLMLWPWHCNLRQKEGCHRASRLRCTTIAILFYFSLALLVIIFSWIWLFSDPSFSLPLPQILPPLHCEPHAWDPKLPQFTNTWTLTSSSFTSSPQQSRSLKHSKKLDCKPPLIADPPKFL